MKVLWVGDSPNVDTGFARCTRAACAALADAGHQVAIVGINEPGDTPTDDTGWRRGPPPRPPTGGPPPPIRSTAPPTRSTEAWTCSASPACPVSSTG
jgi:hypothetical protein